MKSQFDELDGTNKSINRHPVFTKVLDKQSQLMNSPCGDPNKELNHKEENQ